MSSSSLFNTLVRVCSSRWAALQRPLHLLLFAEAPTHHLIDRRGTFEQHLPIGDHAKIDRPTSISRRIPGEIRSGAMRPSSAMLVSSRYPVTGHRAPPRNRFRSMGSSQPDSNLI